MKARIPVSLRQAWQTFSRPSRTFSLGFLTLGGFIAGVVFWGGFNTALEATNRSGVRASCPDCHVPHQWTDKIARKMQASKEVWGKIFGTIDTRDKFFAKRRELAEYEWARLKANTSLECRNCHSADSMDITKQGARAARIHEQYLFTGERTCIDCHKGIAHRLPDMQGVPPGWSEVSDNPQKPIRHWLANAGGEGR